MILHSVSGATCSRTHAAVDGEPLCQRHLFSANPARPLQYRDLAAVRRGAVAVVVGSVWSGGGGGEAAAQPVTAQLTLTALLDATSGSPHLATKAGHGAVHENPLIAIPPLLLGFSDLIHVNPPSPAQKHKVFARALTVPCPCCLMRRSSLLFYIVRGRSPVPQGMSAQYSHVRTPCKVSPLPPSTLAWFASVGYLIAFPLLADDFHGGPCQQEKTTGQCVRGTGSVNYKFLRRHYLPQYHDARR